MQVLTPSGYVDASTLSVGDSVIGWNNGVKVTNTTNFLGAVMDGSDRSIKSRLFHILFN